MPVSVHSIRLKKGAERRLRRGHRWVFSNEVNDSLRGLEPGELVEIVSWTGKFLGIGTINPHALIAVRLFSRRRVAIDRAFLQGRIQRAAELRRWLPGIGEAHRLVYADADFLPGLVVDRYGQHLVIQTLTQGMARLEEVILDILEEAFSPASIYCRNDSPARVLEKLPLERRLATGRLPEELVVKINGLEFRVDILGGQKTGLFLDQRCNWSWLRDWVQGDKVLDGCCYQGAWGVHAACHGAKEVVAVDSSEAALAVAAENLRLNGVESKCRLVRSDIFSFLRETEETFDVIILDPPAFIKSRAKIKEGERGYLDLNRRALLRLRPGGLLITCSCSHLLGEARLRELVCQAGRLSRKELRLLEARGQAPDHPVLPAMPETAYLKCLALQMLPLADLDFSLPLP